ncbi:MAG: dTDP-4-dehydrorhamnose 3,5-epimerase [Gammaproteobacteria bacterium]
MRITETQLRGVFVVDLEKVQDHRGFFSRVFCAKEFQECGLCDRYVQANIAFNNLANTLRGMHYQAPPFQEVKLVSCTKGAIFDVVIDLRPESETYKQWFGIELNEDNYRMLYVPKDFAHGYQTLTDGSQVFYQVSQYYSPAYERGVRWDDPAFGVDWPAATKRIISAKDKSWINFESNPGGRDR